MKHAKLEVKTLPLSKLQPHPRNPRTHPEPGSEAWATMKRSLADNYFDPLVWNRKNGKLVSGHFRTKVLAEMGVEKADVVVVNLPEKEHVRMLLRANTNQGDWATDELTELLKGMDDAERLLAGFDEELETLAPVTLKKLEIKTPPKMAWTLIGIPIDKFGSVQKLLDALPKNAVVQTTANDQNGQS